MRDEIEFLAIPIAGEGKGRASVCVEIEGTTYEDPDHANVPFAEAQEAAEEYATRPINVLDITSNWTSL